MPSNPGYPPDDQQQQHNPNYPVHINHYYEQQPLQSHQRPPQHGFYQQPPPPPQQPYPPYQAYPSAPYIQQPPPIDFAIGVPHPQPSYYPYPSRLGPDGPPDLAPHSSDHRAFAAHPSFDHSPTPLPAPTPPPQSYPLHQNSSSPYAHTPVLGGVASPALSGVASPAWPNPSHQPQQQQQQQQLLQPLPPHLASSSVSPLPIAAPTPPPVSVPSEPSATVSPTKPPPKITLRLPRASVTTNSDPDMASRSRRASATTLKKEPEPSASNRPQRSSRAAAKRNYAEDDDEDDYQARDSDDSDAKPSRRSAAAPASRRSTRATRSEQYAGDDDFEDKMMDTSPVIQEVPSGRPRRKRVIDPDDDEEEEFVPDTNGGHAEPAVAEAEPVREESVLPPSQARTRHSSADAESFAPDDSEQDSPSPSPDPIDDYEDDDDDDSIASATPQRRRTRASVAARSTRNTRGRRANADSDGEYGARRSLRKRESRPNYELPPMDISAEIAAADIMNKAIAAASGPRGRGRAAGLTGGAFGALGGGAASKPFPWSMKGKDFARAMGDPDSSDSDDNLQPMANAAAGPSALGGGGGRAAGPGGVPGPTDVPNFGRVNPKSSMADADPLGVDVNVTFDRVGGLDDHINQLKEMVALPLLYPELFQQFKITPPRGVLFHGPPGTGKTLLARALAASCSNGNTKIAFFMRKGADVLSKWVGEAERQLRMLFEEARASQPSIIFFDEIDGLAPVRSSKQDQIHASLVSTLLALMDGMDGRGQVIVIGATNRPDAVDPALRRPGRFDREFYFPLPNRDARKQIIRINTRDWEPALPDPMVDTLSTITKGYGGSDLRALCTEAALNAIQRRYPQIYKTTDRLQVQPGSVHVQPKDFMLAVKKIVPSSARSASSAAIQLPNQLVPLLSKQLDELKAAVDRAIPPNKKRTALEEAEYEDEDGDTFEKEMMLQSLDKLRTYRPRLLVYGPAGSGQTYLGPAILHHLEGFHVQSLDLATLMSDSTRTPEAAIVQLFVEAKRHQPSIIFIPSLAQWSYTVSETTRSTARALLDGIPPSDPILLLAIVDGELDTLPPDVRAWFGFGDENRLKLGQPKAEEREEFFAEILAAASRPPTDFPDGVPRKRRVLEVLPPAPPLPPRQPTEAEVARETERDIAARNMLFVSFSSLVSEFMKKYRRPVAFVKDDAFHYAAMLAQQAEAAANPPKTPPQVEVVEPVIGDDGAAIVVEAATAPAEPMAVDGGEGPLVAQAQEMLPPPAVVNVDAETTAAPSPAPVSTWQAHDMDIDTIQRKLVRHKYFTPNDFLADVALIEENAKYSSEADRQIRVSEMVAHARMHVQSFDQKWIPEFERYAVRMRERKAERAKAKEAAAKEAADKAAAAEKEVADREAAGNGTNGGIADASAESAQDQAAAGEGETSAAPAPEANGLKRAREDEGAAAGSEGPVEKRPREDAMDVDSAPVAPESGAPGAPVNENGSAQAAPDAAAEPGPVPSPNGSATPHVVPAAPTAPASPEPVRPPLVVPEGALQSLGSFLRDGTAILTVEQLEQLRAALLDRVWRQRTSWDRTDLITDMRQFAGKFVSEVREMVTEVE